MSIEWSDAGKTTIDLQFTLNKTFEKELQKIFENQTREEMKRNGTLNESKNMTEQEKQQLEQQIQREGQQRMQQFLEKLLNLSRQNFTSGNFTNMNFTDMNWSDMSQNFTPWNATMNWSQYNQTWNQSMNWSQYNQTWNQSMNWSQPNQTWNWSSNFTNQGNWSQFNQTWNQTHLNETYHNYTTPNETRINQSKEEEKQRQEMLRNLTSFTNNTAIQFLREATSDPRNFWLFLIAALFGATLVAGVLYARARLTSRVQEARVKEAKEMFRRVNISEVVRKVKALGAEEKYDEAIVYGYNELADYISFVFRILNDPSKTAREFAKAVEADVDVDSLKAITYVFEKTRYAKNAGKAEFGEFLGALVKLAKYGE